MARGCCRPTYVIWGQGIFSVRPGGGFGATAGGPPLYEKIRTERRYWLVPGEWGGDILGIDARNREAWQDDTTNIGGTRPYEPGPARNHRNRINTIDLGRSGLRDPFPDPTDGFRGEDCGGEWAGSGRNVGDGATTRRARRGGSAWIWHRTGTSPWPRRRTDGPGYGRYCGAGDGGRSRREDKGGRADARRRDDDGRDATVNSRG